MFPSAYQKRFSVFSRPLMLVMAAVSMAVASQVMAQKTNALAQAPLFISENYPPLNLLVMGRDHKLYYEAYNDAADLDGDGALDVGYDPKIDYFGYFHNRVCYEHNGSMFVPKSAAGGSDGKQCNNAWSGDFLNYLTTSRMDAIRKVLYGGYRVEDTPTRTVLQTAYIPQDSHSWGKAYDTNNSPDNPTRDTYDISKYSPLSAPAAGKRHLFAVTTMEQDGAPELRVMPDTTFLLWNWISKEAPVARVTCNHPTLRDANGWPKTVSCDPITRYTLKVEVCSNSNPALRDSESCKAYPNNGGAPIYKPVGILHDFGENNKMYFGLLTGSYQKNTTGGVLRKNIGKFTDEVDPQTGQFRTNVEGLVRNINALKMTDFIYNKANPDYIGGVYQECGWKVDGSIADGNFDSSKCSMWGNPIGEMMFEGLRYFAGADNALLQYMYGANSKDSKLGFPAPPKWQSPYKTKAEGGGDFKYCAKPVMTVLSDINPSYDYHLPKSRYANLSADAARLSSFDVSKETDAIGTAEGLNGKQFFIGQTTSSNADSAPTVKTVNGLSWVRGLSPEEPSKQGTYYSAGVARFGANNAVAGDPSMPDGKGMNKVMTYSVAIASPLPEIRFPVGNGRFVTISPFAKSIWGSGNLSPNGNFQPTNQIVEYFVTRIANTGTGDRDSSVNGGRPYAQFRINFEDVEQGADHDMDAIALYTIAQQANGTVKIDMKSEYASGSIMQNMGYVISGTTKDGTYLEIRDADTSESYSKLLPYRLNTPPGEDPGFCNKSPMPSKCRDGLPLETTRTFTPSGTGAGFLKGPLWYAAKYGMPDRDPATVTGDPNNYFLVTNAGTLKEQMTKAFNSILQTTSSVTAVAVESKVPLRPTGVAAEANLYRTEFESVDWSGDLIKEKSNRSASGTSSRERVWSAADRLADRTTDRKSYFAGKDRVGKTVLSEFDWNNLSLDEAWKAALDKNSGGVVDNRGADRVSFLRGSTPTGMRERKKLESGKTNILGDIVNSSALRIGAEGKGIGQYRAEAANALEGSKDSNSYGSFENGQAKVPEMVYIGANDGMLHAFNAITGEEVFAYIPSGVRNNLSVLTEPGYGKSGVEHRYFVDGTPVAADVYFRNGSGADTGWRKVLLGTLGAGGRQIFALDVTNPTMPKLLWEFGSDQEKGKNLGLMAEPVIARLNDDGDKKGKWVALISAGYQGAESMAGKTSMFVLDIQTGEVLREFGLDSGVTSGLDPLGNGLSRLSAVDNNGDGKIDMVSAGDLLGDVWRIDMRSGKSNAWSAGLFYVAKDSSGNRQPITAAPHVIHHPLGRGNIVVVATGRYLTLEDKGDAQTQSIYGIWDRYSRGGTATPTPMPTANKGRSHLQKQEFADANLGNAPGAKVLTDNEVKWLKNGAQVSDNDDKVDQWGWYVDLTNIGERVVYDMTLYGRGLWLNSIYNDESDPCKPGLSGMLYAIDPEKGGKLDYQAIDITGNSIIDGDDSPEGKISSGWKWSGGKLTFGRGDVFSPDGSETKIASGVQKGRQSWRRQPENR